MGLYVGREKRNIVLDGVIYCLNLFTAPTQAMTGIVLLSSDNCILKDVDGLYLTAEESE